MGEAVVSGGDGMEWEVQETGVVGASAEQQMKSSSVVSWERFLPKMAVRVLLVEADDSTRQIIAALLRKCSYKVAAVSDGLKAWEVLRGRSHNIDLILTEVELPSISGYALLTLIMEHHSCKNIPVIMMSSQDSVSTVYKCMLRGAADFLVKPVRKNELRNLWQHVWRKQNMRSSSVGNDHTSVYKACVKSNRKSVDKENDAQSSCTKPELESGGTDIENTHFPSQLSDTKFMSHVVNTKEAVDRESRETHPRDNGASESEAEPKMDADYGATLGQGKNSYDDGWEKPNESNHMLENSAKEAIDLIGTFDNCLKGSFGSSITNVSANKFDVLPVLDLSLRRSHLSGSVNQVNDENQRLNHSDASAFSRYKNMALQSSISRSPSTCNQPKNQEIDFEKPQSNHVPDYTSDTHASTITSQKVVSMANIPSLHPEITLSYPLQRNIAHPIPVKGAGLVIDSYDCAMPTIFSTQAGLSPLVSPYSAHNRNHFPKFYSFHPSEHQTSDSETFHGLMHHCLGNAINRTTEGQQMQESQNLDDVCFRIWSGNKGKIDAISVHKGASECNKEEASHAYQGMPHRSLQREAAVSKFRLKRKERCFEKKVRYESRKKLAEQRPRVKGQFVRQVPNEV